MNSNGEIKNGNRIGQIHFLDSVTFFIYCFFTEAILEDSRITLLKAGICG